MTRSFIQRMVFSSLLYCLLMVFSNSVFAQKPFFIRGKIADLPDGTVIALLKNEGNLLTTVARDTVKAGSFKFSGTLTELSDYGIMGHGPGFPSQWLELWIKPGSQLSLSGSGKLLKTWKVTSDVTEQKDVSRFTLASGKYWDRLQALSVQENALFDQRETATADQRKVLKRGVDSLRVIQDTLRRLIDRSDLSVLSSTPKHGRVWMNKLKDLARSSKYSADTLLKKDVLSVYRALPDAERNSFSGVEVYNLLFPPITVKIGEKIADTLLKSLDGKLHRLSDYKGKYVLIDFWSIGCAPCIAAMPELKKLHESLSDHVTMVSFSLDQNPAIWKKGSEHVKMDWVNLSDGKGMTGLAAKYGVSGIPHYIIISPDGNLLDSWVGYTEGLLTKKLEALIKR